MEADLNARSRGGETDDSATARSNQVNEILRGYPGLAQNGAQGASINLAVVGNNCLSEWSLASHDDVASMLPPDNETALL